VATNSRATDASSVPSGSRSSSRSRPCSSDTTRCRPWSEAHGSVRIRNRTGRRRGPGRSWRRRCRTSRR
jgi:hypothetical protein